jgi:hypothetical protein
MQPETPRWLVYPFAIVCGIVLALMALRVLK